MSDNKHNINMKDLEFDSELASWRLFSTENGEWVLRAQEHDDIFLTEEEKLIKSKGDIVPTSAIFSSILRAQNVSISFSESNDGNINEVINEFNNSSESNILEDDADDINNEPEDDADDINNEPEDDADDINNEPEDDADDTDGFISSIMGLFSNNKSSDESENYEIVGMKDTVNKNSLLSDKEESIENEEEEESIENEEEEESIENEEEEESIENEEGIISSIRGLFNKKEEEKDSDNYKIVGMKDTVNKNNTILSDEQEKEFSGVEDQEVKSNTVESEESSTSKSGDEYSDEKKLESVEDEESIISSIRGMFNKKEDINDSDDLEIGMTDTVEENSILSDEPQNESIENENNNGEEQ